MAGFRAPYQGAADCSANQPKRNRFGSALNPAAIFDEQKPIHAERGRGQRGKLSAKGENMEYLITFGVISMVALYAVIIIGCYRQPEW